MSIGITGGVLFPLPLLQNGLASYENQSHTHTHTMYAPHRFCILLQITAKTRLVADVSPNLALFLSNQTVLPSSMGVGNRQKGTLGGEMESLQNLVWEWREEEGR